MNNIGSVILLLISFLSFSCNKKVPSEPEKTFFDIQGENGFVGSLNGTNAFVSILIGENEGIAYVCNGDEEISEWFKGNVNQPTEINFTNSNGTQVSAHLKDKSFKGEITLSNGTSHSFIATTSSSEYAGIYRIMGDAATHDKIDAGWIINSDEDQRGSLTINAVFQPIPPLNIRDLKDGTSNTVLLTENKSYPVFRFLIKKPTPPALFVPVPYLN